MCDDKRIECYKCGKFLGIIRDGWLHKDLYYVCKECIIKPREQAKNDMPEFMKDIFGGFK